MKSLPVPTQQFMVFTRTEFGENLAFHSDKCIFHMAEHINKKNRYNNRKLSWLRILARYQKTVQLLGVTEPTKIYKLAKQCLESCSSRTVCSITQHLHFFVQCLKVVLHCQWLRESPALYSYSAKAESCCTTWKHFVAVCISSVNISKYLTMKLIFRGKIILSQIYQCKTPIYFKEPSKIYNNFRKHQKASQLIFNKIQTTAETIKYITWLKDSLIAQSMQSIKKHLVKHKAWLSWERNVQ